MSLCSAGVGRTGTLIALDMLLQQMDKDRVVSIADCVHHMRISRPLMVQTQVGVIIRTVQDHYQFPDVIFITYYYYIRISFMFDLPHYALHQVKNHSKLAQFYHYSFDSLFDLGNNVITQIDIGIFFYINLLGTKKYHK